MASLYVHRLHNYNARVCSILQNLEKSRYSQETQWRAKCSLTGFSYVYLAKSVRQDILKDLKTAKYFPLLVDESMECGNEQISVFMRCVCEGVLNEDFFNLVRAEGLGANSIMNNLRGLSSHGCLRPRFHDRSML